MMNAVLGVVAHVLADYFHSAPRSSLSWKCHIDVGGMYVNGFNVTGP